jgi:hypothetical protein
MSVPLKKMLLLYLKCLSAGILNTAQSLPKLRLGILSPELPELSSQATHVSKDTVSSNQ